VVSLFHCPSAFLLPAANNSPSLSPSSFCPFLFPPFFPPHPDASLPLPSLTSQLFQQYYDFYRHHHQHESGRVGSTTQQQQLQHPLLRILCCGRCAAILDCPDHRWTYHSPGSLHRSSSNNSNSSNNNSNATTQHNSNSHRNETEGGKRRKRERGGGGKEGGAEDERQKWICGRYGGWACGTGRAWVSLLLFVVCPSVCVCVCGGGGGGGEVGVCVCVCVVCVV